MTEKLADKKDAKAEARLAAADSNKKLELGATLTLSAADAIADPDNDIEAGRPAKWSATNNAAVIATEDLTGDTVDVVGSALGKTRVSYTQKVDISADDAIAAAFAGAKYTDDVHARHSVYWDIEVVPVGSLEPPPPETLSSSKFDGLIPVNEPQDKPSEKTPYGIGLENKPVAPFPGMVRPNDDSTVARQSEDAVAVGSAAGIARAKEEAKHDKKDDNPKHTPKPDDDKKK